MFCGITGFLLADNEWFGIFVENASADVIGAYNAVKFCSPTEHIRAENGIHDAEILEGNQRI